MKNQYKFKFAMFFMVFLFLPFSTIMSGDAKNINANFLNNPPVVSSDFLIYTGDLHVFNDIPVDTLLKRYALSADNMQECNYTVVLYDDYGDGWTGGFLNVYVDGSIVLEAINIENGYGPETYTLPLYSGALIQFEYTAGEFPFDCSYFVYDSFGNLVFEDGVGETVPQGGEIIAECDGDTDWGDAPDGIEILAYPTLAIHGGAHHNIVSGVHLGASVDGEQDGQPSPAAVGDDNNPFPSDEDGIQFLTSIVPGKKAVIRVVASVDGYLNAWLDFDRNKDWTGEKIFNDKQLLSGLNFLEFNVPDSALTGTTFARFRYTTYETYGDLSFKGPAEDGEVIDRLIEIVMPEDQSKMHRPQWPDLTTNGVDVFCMSSPDVPFGVADDFMCMETGLITDIHIWGSWLNDYVPDLTNMPGFRLSIWSDNPEGPNGHSQPKELLCDHYFEPGNFTMEKYVDVPDGEWFYWPQWGESSFPGDNEVYKLDFYIPQAEACVQDSGSVYWLSVTALGETGSNFQFGWKSSRNHFNDFAVWTSDPPAWNMICYPDGHLLEDLCMDMAFYISGHPEILEKDWGDAPDGVGIIGYPTLGINDGANHAIVPGVRLGPSIDSEPNGKPSPAAVGDDNNPFPSDEDGVQFMSSLVPGKMAKVVVRASTPGFLNVWLDIDRNNSWAGEQMFTDRPLNTGFNILYLNLPASAVTGTTYARFRFTSYDTQGLLGYKGAADDGEVEDYLIEIIDEQDECKMHFPQWPDLTTDGMDVFCMTGQEGYVVVADDFACSETGLITDIHLWGSWLNDVIPEDNLPTFHLSIWSDNPEGPNGYSQPKDLLCEYYFDQDQYGMEEYVQVPDGEWFYWPHNGNANFPGDFKVWKFNFYIPPDVACLQDSGSIYWLSVNVIDEIGIGSNYKFGWKTSKYHYNDNAVWSPDPPIWNILCYPEEHPLVQYCTDMAFYISGQPTATPEIRVKDCPADDGSVPSNINCPQFWTSWDVWIDNNNDGIRDAPVVGAVNNLWGRVHNNGPGVANNVNIDLYYRNNTTGLTYPAGAPFIGSISGLTVPAGGSATGLVPWMVPAPPTTGGHYCIGSVVSAPYDPQTSILPVWDNNVACVNIGYLYARAGLPAKDDVEPIVADFYVRNPFMVPEFFTVEMEGTLLPGWQVEFLSHEGMPINLPLTIWLLPGAEQLITMIVTPPPDAEHGEETLVEVMQYVANVDKQNGELIGGISFESKVDLYKPDIIFDLRAELKRIGIVLSWTEVNTDVTGSPDHIACYNVYRSNVPNFDPNPNNRIGRVAVDENQQLPGFQWIDVNPGEVNYYIVRVEDQAGYESDNSNLGYPGQGDKDFGDAPNDTTGYGYPTLLVNDGARHKIAAGVFLGASVDGEFDGQPGMAAVGDDNNPVPSDEDGVGFLTTLVPGKTARIRVRPSVDGFLNAWVDFDGNLDWNGEQIFINEPVSAGPNDLTFIVPAGSSIGTTYARFRYTTSDNGGQLSYKGPAEDGEVIDRLIEIVSEEDECKMHRPQWPDLTTNGVDVYCMDGQESGIMLADDFLCIETGLITDIHFWGSWLNDMIPYDNMPAFNLKIWSDLPEGPNGYSQPEEVLCEYSFAPGQYTMEELVQVPDGEWFYWPQWQEATFPGDNSVWKFNFYIPEALACAQDSGKVYWLSVKAHWDEPGNYQFGWKSSRVKFNDKAVWTQDPPAWNMLCYPEGHLLQDMCMEMAFYISGQPGSTEEFDWGDAPDGYLAPIYPTLSSNNGAHHLFDGYTFMGWDIDLEGNGIPHSLALGDDLDNQDDEDGVKLTKALLPGGSTGVDVYANGNCLLNAWFDFNNDGSWAEASDHVFINVPLLPGWNNLTLTLPRYTSPGDLYSRFRVNSNGGIPYDGYGYEGEVEDYKFCVYDTIPGIKMGNPQFPDPNGWDINFTFPSTVADDWICNETGPVEDFHFWVSWLNDILPDEFENAVQRFDLAIYSDIPDSLSSTGYSMPGEELWFQGFVPGQFNWTPVCDHLQGWYDPIAGVVDPQNHYGCYRIDIVNFEDPFVQDEGTVYWLVITAHLTGGGGGGQSVVVTLDGIDPGMPPYTDWTESDVVLSIRDVDGYGPNYLIDPDGINLWPALLHCDLSALAGPIVKAEVDVEPYCGPGCGATVTLYEGALQLDQQINTASGIFETITVTSPAGNVPDLLTIGCYEGKVFEIRLFIEGEEGHQIGWKTSNTHWNDNAVYMNVEENSWYELWDPMGDEKIDMAFLITGSTEPQDLFDWGDAPDGNAAPIYPTLFSNNGAYHSLDGYTFMGWDIDPEGNGIPHSLALGDDWDNLDDEDGVDLMNALLPGGTAGIKVYANGSCMINAWFDLNNNGSWAEATDHKFVNVPLAPGWNNLTLSLPQWVAPGDLYARFRVNSNGGISYDGYGYEGEVEDYKFCVYDTIPNIKMGNPQYPDPNGWDINFTYPSSVADDWICSETGPVEDFHFWVSWLNDVLPDEFENEVQSFDLSIYSDIPDSISPTGYSMPGEELWFHEFAPGQFSWTPVCDHLQGWYDPVGNVVDPENHFYCYRIDIVNFDDPFIQTEGTVYWLEISVHLMGGGGSQTITVTLDNVDASTLPYQTWIESDVELSIRDVDGYGPTYQIDPDGINLWPALLNCDLTGLPSTVIAAEIDVMPFCGPGCGADVILYEAGSIIDQNQNTASGGMETITVANPGGFIPDQLTIGCYEGKVLEIRIFTSGSEGYQIGWKTSVEHWNDNAVYKNEEDNSWYELWDPLTQEKIDMAFLITGTPGPGSADIWIKDCDADFGTVPSSGICGGYVCAGPDIWIDNDSDGIIDAPVVGTINKLYIRGRNLGPVAANNVTASLYYRNSSTGLNFPTGATFIGSVNLPPIPVNGSANDWVPWLVPAPPAGTSGHWCIGGIVTAPYDPQTAQWSPNDNNVCFVNIWALYGRAGDPVPPKDGPDPIEAEFLVRNPFDMTGTFMFDTEVELPDDWIVEYSHQGNPFSLPMRAVLSAFESRLVNMKITPPDDAQHGDGGIVIAKQFFAQGYPSPEAIVGDITFPVVVDLHPPEAITDLDATEIRAGVLLSWTPARHDIAGNLDNIACYNVYRGETSDFDPSLQNRVGRVAVDQDPGVQGFQWVDENFGEVNYYIVRVEDEAGYESENSNVAFTHEEQDYTFEMNKWRGISSYLDPINPDVQTMFQGLIDDQVLTILYNTDLGVFWPGGNVYTLNTWDSRFGYVLKTAGDADFVIRGADVSDKTLYIPKEHWIALPVLSRTPESVAGLFASFEDNCVVKSIASWEVYWPQYGINTIEFLIPGDAYYVFSSIEGSVNYASNGSDFSLVELPEMVNLTPWNDVHYSPLTHVVAFTKDVVSSFEPGDVIAAFTNQGVCAAMAEYRGNEMSLSLTGDDVYTSLADGFITDETIKYQLYRPSTNQVFNIDVIYEPSLDNSGLFHENSMSAVVDLKISATGINEPRDANVYIYPNPTKGTFTIEGLVSVAEVEIYASYGKIVFTDNMYDRELIDLSTLPKGVYLVKVRDKQGMHYEKLILK